MTRLTTNSDETTVSDLLMSNSIFQIPYFQRAYRWGPKTLNQLERDVLSLVDGSDDIHFLGAIIVHGRPSAPATPTIYDVIDGQQRLTSIFIYLCAIVKTLASNDCADEAERLFLAYIGADKAPKGTPNIKLYSCKEDRQQINRIVLDVLDVIRSKDFLHNFAFIPLPAPPNAVETGRAWKNYRKAQDFARREWKMGGHQRLTEVYTRLVQNITVVQIDVKDPTSGPKIFDSLNSRQEPMSIGDLVRNLIFSKVASEDPNTIESIDENYWQPFYQKFFIGGRNFFDEYFFPFGIIHDENTKKSEVYNHLRERWVKFDRPKDIIEDLRVYQDDFLQILTGNNYCGHPEQLKEKLQDLRRLGAPSATYPFLMKLSNAARSDGPEKISPEDAVGALEVIESFLVRRAVCGFEPTGLHAVFKRLWNDCEGDLSARRICKEIGKHKTVFWPSSREFKECVKTRRIDKSGIVKFLLLEYDKSFGADQPNDIPWIEHVLPQNPSSNWKSLFPERQREQYVGTLANLLPLSKEMNAELSNKEYKQKREAYHDDSMFKSARDFAERYRSWTPDDVKKRASELADWAVERWPYGPAGKGT